MKMQFARFCGEVVATEPPIIRYYECPFLGLNGH